MKAARNRAKTIACTKTPMRSLATGEADVVSAESGAFAPRTSPPHSAQSTVLAMRLPRSNRSEDWTLAKVGPISAASELVYGGSRVVRFGQATGTLP